MQMDLEKAVLQAMACGKVGDETLVAEELEQAANLEMEQ